MTVSELFSIFKQNNIPNNAKDSCRPPETIKKDIKHEKNPMRLKQLNQELNKSYKIYRTRRK